MVYTQEDGRRQPLSSLLAAHPIWMETEVWKLCLQRVINLKFQDAVTLLEKQKKDQDEQIKREKESGLVGFFKKGITKITEKEPEPEKPKQTMRISKVLAQNIVFNSQSSFIGFFVGLKLSFEQGRLLMLHFCKKYELDQSRTHLLLSELEAGQKN